MILWDPAGHFCSGWVDNSLEDGSLSFRVDSSNFAQQEVEFAIKFTIFSKWQRRCGRFEIWWKNWFILFQLSTHFQIILQTDVRLSCPNHTGRKTAESQPKDLNNFGELAQFLVQIMACRVQLRLWQGGLVSVSEKRREYSKLRIR